MSDNKAEKALRWIANQIPDQIYAKTNEEKMLVAIKLYCDAGANEIAHLIKERDEYKSKAEVAERNDKIKERALDKATELAYEYRTETDMLSCSSCPMFHIFDSCKERGLYVECAKRWKEAILQESEKEIAEEDQK